MAENIFVPHFHRNSEYESSEHTPIEFNTLFGVSSIVGGAGRAYMSSHSNTNPVNNNSMLVPTPAPTQPSLGEEYFILPRQSNVDMAPFHRNSENESSEHTPIGFNTLFGISSIVGGAGRAYMSSHSNTNSVNNNSMLVPTPSPTQPSLGEEHFILPHQSNDDMAPSSSKRPRGRPLGSKNKPKKSILVTKEADSQLSPINLIIPAGNDIIKSVINYAQRRNTSITVLKASGPVSSVTLLHPNSCVPASPIQGTYNMTSLSGTWVNPNCRSVYPQFITNPSCSSFVICFSGVQGEIYGGNVGGKVKAAGEIIVFATLTNKPVFPWVAPVYRNIKEVEEDDQRYVANQALVEQDNINNCVLGANSTLLTRQPLPSTGFNVMGWDHSTLADNYYYYK